MSFLFPFFIVGGAVSAAIPVIIHLLNKRKFDRVVWAAMRFLQTSVEQNQRRIQLEDVLLLLVRVALLLLIALALARPALKASQAAGLFGQSKVTAVILLDNSYSMSQTDGVTSRFDRAKKAAADAIDTLPAGSSTAMFLASDVADPLIPEPTYDLNLARQTLQKAQLSDRSTNLLRPVQAAVELLKKKGGLRREIYLITDGQASGFRQLDDIVRVLDESKDDIRTHVLLAGAAETSNLGVSGLRMDSDIPAAGRDQTFYADVTNFGATPAAGVQVSLRIDDEDACDEAVIDALPPGQTRGAPLVARFRGDGYHTVTASVPHDHLPADDSRTIAVRVVRNVKVLLVDGDPGPRPKDAETFYLRQALMPVPRAEADNWVIKCTTTPVADLPAHRFDDFDVVVLANVTDLDPVLVKPLGDFVRRGSGLVVFPGPNTQPRFFNDALLGQQHLMPAALGEARGDAAGEKFITLQSKNFDHPIADLWNDAANGDLGKMRFFKWFELTPAKPAGDAGTPRVVVSFTDGTPAVMERPVGLGTVVLFASSAKTEWNNMAVAAEGGLWPPLMYRVVGWVVQRQDRGLNIKVGQPIIFHPPIETVNRTATITRPGGPDTPRDSATVGVDAQKVPTLVYGFDPNVAGDEQRPAGDLLNAGDTGKAGAYVLSFKDPPLTVKFAAQADKGESSLDDVSEAQLQKLRDVADVVPAGANLRERVEKARLGTELWLPLAVGALILATAETFLADWFSRAK